MKYLLITLLGFLINTSLSYAQQSANDLLNLGYDSYDKGAYQEAIDYFDQAEEIEGDNAELYYLRGICKSMIDDNKAAVQDFDKAVKINPEFAEAYFERGYSYFMLNEAEKAIQSYSEAIRIDPDYGEAYQNRGAVKCMIDDPEGAQQDWDKAKQLGVMVPEMGC